MSTTCTHVASFAYVFTDTQPPVQENWSDGTTAVIALVDDNNRLLLANVGDSEALVSRAGKAVNYSVPHNPSKSPSERERIVKVCAVSGRAVSGRGACGAGAG